MFVNVDLTKELTKSIDFSFQGKDTLIEFTYSWLPVKCSSCGKCGHLSLACIKKPVSGPEQEKEEQTCVTMEETQHEAQTKTQNSDK